MPLDQKSNEIKAVPALLSLLDGRVCTAPFAAMVCQTAIAAQIIQADLDSERKRVYTVCEGTKCLKL